MKKLNYFYYRLKPGGNCPYDELSWIDEKNNEFRLNCFFQDGPLKGKSKGLRQISSELGYEIENNMRLNNLKILLSNHPAFSPEKNLEILAKKYGHRVIFLPKFHCELNPIEGLWCYLKQYIRARTNQKFPKLVELMIEARAKYISIELSKKLIRRFWRCLIAYKNGATYGQILKAYFSGKSRENIQEHLRISNSLA